MKSTKRKPFDALFTGLELVNDSSGTPLNTVLYGKRGEPSVVFSVMNPVQQMKADPEGFILYHEVLSNIVQTLGEGYALQKQDVFCRQSYRHEVPDNAEFLTRCYFKFFNGRKYTHLSTFIIITQAPQSNAFITFDSKKWKEFHDKVDKVANILRDKGLKYKRLNEKEVDEYLHRFMAFSFEHAEFQKF